MKYNVDMALAKLTNLSNLTYLGPWAVYKSKFDRVGIHDAVTLYISIRIRIRIRIENLAISPAPVDFDQMYVKYNVAMTLAKLTSMSNNLNLDPMAGYKPKFDQVGFLEIIDALRI